MKITTVSVLLLCSLLLVQDVRAQIGNSKSWFSVYKWGPLPVATARRQVWNFLGMSPFMYWLYMDSAEGAWWNNWQQRYTRFSVGFTIRVNHWPWKKYKCGAIMAWPKFGPPYFVVMPGANWCWEI